MGRREEARSREFDRQLANTAMRVAVDTLDPHREIFRSRRPAAAPLRPPVMNPPRPMHPHGWYGIDDDGDAN